MKYNVTKRIDGNRELSVEIRLDDECRNGYDYFAITSDLYEIKKNNRKVWSAGGCCHDFILKYFPEFGIFVDLHLCDNAGVPMHAVSNGYYHLQKSGSDVVKSYLRASDDEVEVLKTAEDKEHFKYLIHKVGLLKKWDSDANKAIEVLESLTGEKYDKESGAHNDITLLMSDSEYELFLKREKEGYYSPENLEIRKKQREDKERAERLEKLENEYNKDKEKLERNYKLKRAIAELSPKTNFIFYDFKNEVKFNWIPSSYDEFTMKELNEFIPILQDKFPDITFLRQ